MFKILDGREAFYQWDTNRQVVVDDRSITQVHYCNRTDDCALICECYELDSLWVADVPNVLLQDNWRIRVYAFDGNATKHEARYDVIARSKPDTYVYTETEVLSYETINKRMDAIETDIEGVAEEVIKEYLEENDIKVDLTGYATEEYVDNAIEQIELTPGPQGIPGKDGKDGQDGYTPVKGKDYFDGAPGADGKDYILTQADKAEIAGMVEVTGGGGESAPEVYIGTSAPTDSNYKIWVDTDEEDNYATKGFVNDAINTIELTPGPAGKDGKDGYTPVKGVDYFDGAPGADGKDYVLTEADKQEIAGMVEVTGGSGGSVAVDGKTIIQNADGTISAAIGGAKTINTPKEIIYDYENPVGFTKSTKWFLRGDNNGNTTYKRLDKTKQYDMYVEVRYAPTAEIFACNCKLNINIDLINNDIWDISGFTFTNDAEGATYTIEKFYNHNSQGYPFLQDKLSQDYFITRIEISYPPIYDYEPINTEYINIGPGLTINGEGQLDSAISGIRMIGGITGMLAQESNIGPADNGMQFGVALGYGNQINKNGNTSIAIGYLNTIDSSVTGNRNMLFGRENLAKATSSSSCHSSFAFGQANTVRATNTYAFGYGLTVSSEKQTAYGKFNLEDTSSTYNLIIGNGASASELANGLTIATDGSIVTQGTISNAGADYAEYFEWADGNPNNEDRVGLLVTLDGNKIRCAKAIDDVLGVVSGTATVLGDDAEWTWQGKYLRDEFGRLIMEEREIVDEEDGSIYKYITPKINPEFDEKKEYISRAKRSEWDAIGMMGKLFVKDDGTCVVNGYAMPGENGVATLATGKSNMKVMERISDSIVRVLLK